MHSPAIFWSYTGDNYDTSSIDDSLKTVADSCTKFSVVRITPRKQL